MVVESVDSLELKMVALKVYLWVVSSVWLTGYWSVDWLVVLLALNLVVLKEKTTVDLSETKMGLWLEMELEQVLD